MQIQNFYTDWMPAASSALDNIVLSPHTLKPNDFALSGMQDDYGNSHARVCICDHDHSKQFASAQKYNGHTCRLKKCLNWFGNRQPNRREEP